MERTKTSLTMIIVEVIVGVSVPVIIYFLSTLTTTSKIELISPIGQVAPKFSVVWTPPKQECRIYVYQLGKQVWGQEKQVSWYQSGQAIIELCPSRYEYILMLTDRAERTTKTAFCVIGADKVNLTPPVTPVGNGQKPVELDKIKPDQGNPEQGNPEDNIPAVSVTKKPQPLVMRQQVLVNAQIKGQRKKRLISVYKPLVTLETPQGKKIYIDAATQVKPGRYKLTISAPGYWDKTIVSYAIPDSKDGRFTICEVLIGRN